MIDRRDKILEEIEIAGEISLTELSRKFGVSELTIRRDIKPLEGARKIKVGKGKVVFIPQDPSAAFPDPDPSNETIAETASRLIGDNDRFIWLGGGNISIGIARRLSNITLVTNSLSTALAALKKKNVKVHLVGDEFHPETYCLFGRSLTMLREFTFNKAFIEVDGYFSRNFLLPSNMAEVASLLSGNVKEKYILIREDDFGNVNSGKLKGLKEFRAVLTDALKISDLREIERIGVQVICGRVEADPERKKVVVLKQRK